MADLTVGTGEEYSTISSAVQASSAGDTIDVQAGTYTNDFLTITHDLTLQAVGGMVSMVATTPPPNEKALIDEGGSGVSVSIQGFAVSGVSIPDSAGANGAGIRYEGGTLTLTGDDIYGNQDGLLANPDPAGVITITNTEFADNGTASGAGSGYDHNLYVGAIGTLTIEDSYFTGAIVGHEIKSRAAVDVITDNRIQDGPGGTASYDIDLPNGGVATITGNTIEKSPDAGNPIVIAYGEEGNVAAGSSLVVSGNTILDDMSSPSSVAVSNASSVTASVTGNELYGLSLAEVVKGPGTASGNSILATEPALDTAAPYAAPPAAAELAEVGTAPTDAPCYCAGTRILTVGGEVAVEALRIGDRVMALLGGGLAPVRWIGHRTLDLRGHPAPERVRPVCIRRGALAEGQPHRDLRVSPGHALLVDGVLIQAELLVNGISIVQEDTDRVTYWHVELERHDVLLAEGVPAESYLDTGNRTGFAEAGAFQELHPDFRPRHWAETCAPLVQDGPALEAVKARLLRRAREAFEARTTADPGLHVLADGAVVWPSTAQNGVHRFTLPAGCRTAWLASRCWVPAQLLSASTDTRRLGVCVRRVVADGRVLPLDDARLATGWHELERDTTGDQRWTAGAAMLPAGVAVLEVQLGGFAAYWSDPDRVGEARAA